MAGLCDDPRQCGIYRRLTTGRAGLPDKDSVKDIPPDWCGLGCVCPDVFLDAFVVVSCKLAGDRMYMVPPGTTWLVEERGMSVPSD